MTYGIQLCGLTFSHNKCTMRQCNNSISKSVALA